MKSQFSLGKDVFFPLVLLLFYLFSPFPFLRFFVLLYGLLRILPFIQSKILSASVVVTRNAETVRTKKLKPFEVSLTVRNRGLFAIHFCTVIDTISGPFSAESRRFIIPLKRGESRVITYNVYGTERGMFTLGPVVVRGKDAFGLFTWEKRIEAPLQVIIYPSIYQLDLNSKTGLPAGNIKVSNRLYEDVTRYRSIREYIAGDDL